MNCPTCDGKGKMVIKGRTLDANGWHDDPPVTIDCIDCKGEGEITKEKAKELQEMRDAWCSCGNPSGEVDYYEFGHTHGYDCRDCGKIIQTG